MDSFPQFLSCCCGTKNETTQANFQPMNERTPYADFSGQTAQESPDFRRMDEVGSSGTAGDMPPRTYSTEADSRDLPPPPMQANTTASGASSKGGSNTTSRDRDKMEEKAKLQERVQSFAKRATRGIDCFLGVPGSNEWKPATYLLGKGLKEFIVRQDGAADQAHLIADIQDILRAQDDQKVSSHSLARTLDADSQKRMYLVQCGSKEIFLLEQNVEDADIFCSSMRVLRLYCQQQASRK